MKTTRDCFTVPSRIVECGRSGFEVRDNKELSEGENLGVL